jgi:hypothetical protein
MRAFIGPPRLIGPSLLLLQGAAQLFGEAVGLLPNDFRDFVGRLLLHVLDLFVQLLLCLRQQIPPLLGEKLPGLVRESLRYLAERFLVSRGVLLFPRPDGRGALRILSARA